VANFQSEKQLRRHVQRHAAECGVMTDNEYLALASALCDGGCPDGVLECFRFCPPRDTDEKRIRFREGSGEYGVVLRQQPDVLVTFHLLYPRGTVGVGWTHDCDTNRDFFDTDCRCLPCANTHA
jgi:hypothetical protein